MLSIAQLNQLVNGPDFSNKEKWDQSIIKRRDVYYGMSLHIDGACPAWDVMRNPRLGWIPENITQKRPLLGWFGIEYHLIFDNILFNRYPNEPERTRQWRFSAYKPFQKAYFAKCDQMVTGAIFQDSGYRVEVVDKDDNEYIWGNNFEKKNLIQFYAARFKTIVADPNGYFLVIPKESAERTTTDRIEPEIWFVKSSELRYISEDEIAFERDGLRWVVNKFGYFRWRKAQETEQWFLVEGNGYYGHMLGYIPMFVAGGVWNDQGFYESWLHAGKAIADDYVIIKSDEAMCAKQASHPWIIEADAECPHCHGGDVQYCHTCHKRGELCECDEGMSHMTLAKCDACGGTGHISNNPGDRMTAPKEDMKLDLVKVVNIPVDANEMHAKRAERAELNLQKALHLNYIDQAQSAVSKNKDFETRYQFIDGINNDYFDRLIPNSIDAITALRNITVKNGVISPTPGDKIIVKPSQFQIKTTTDLLEEMKSGKDSGIPTYQLNALTEDYVDKQFGGNAVLKRKTSLINQMDILAGKSSADVSVAVLNGFATQRDGQFSLALPLILDALVRENGNEWFLSKKYEVIEAAVQVMFAAKYPPIPKVEEDSFTRIEA